MAKLNGPLGGKLRGKVGEVVAAKTVGGVTAIRSYQPVVKNPRTARQQEARLRFSTASGLAAELAKVLQIGYAKAASALGIYPRNVFVRDVVNHDSGVIGIDLDEVTIEWAKVPVSKRDGIYENCLFAAVASATPGVIDITLNSVPDNGALTDGRMGVVLVAYSEDAKQCIVVQDTAQAVAGSTFEFNVGAAYTGQQMHVFAFFKWIPNSRTDIASTNTPWLYPSATGETHYVGVVTVG